MQQKASKGNYKKTRSFFNIIFPPRQKNMFQFVVQFAFHLTSSSAKHSAALAMLACINYSFTLYLNPRLNGLRSFFFYRLLEFKVTAETFSES